MWKKPVTFKIHTVNVAPFCFRIIEPEALKQGNMSSLGFTSKEQRNLGLLVHLMTANPKILYSPIGSQVDKVIQKVGSLPGRHDNMAAFL